MTKEFDGQLMMSNIEYLLDKRGMKLNKLEETAGISAGYISRVKKDPGAIKPSAEFVMKVADALGVNMDMLVRTELKRLTPTEEYLSGFINKLINDTVADKLLWERQTPDHLANGIKKYDTGNTEHPLLTCQVRDIKTATGITKVMGEPNFESTSFGRDTRIAGNCFKLTIADKTDLYLMKIVMNSCSNNPIPEDYAKELWICRSFDVRQCLCVTKSGLGSQLESLYAATDESTKRPKISAAVQNIIDSFIKKDEIFDDLPF